LARSSDVSHDVRVSEESNDGARAKGSGPEAGVLANLPRTRPQRSSPRRAAAREAASTRAKAKPASVKAGTAKLANAEPAKVKPASAAPTKAETTKVKPAKARPAKARPAKARPANARPAKARPANATPAKKPAKAKRAAGRSSRDEETVPRQGFEVDGDIASGSVQPPGAAELVSSAAELAGELAKAGVTGGARLLKDLFARLPPG
jgi:hypothetical protein